VTDARRYRGNAAGCLSAASCTRMPAIPDLNPSRVVEVNLNDHSPLHQ
jgi:hypothetical protein